MNWKGDGRREGVVVGQRQEAKPSKAIVTGTLCKARSLPAAEG